MRVSYFGYAVRHMQTGEEYLVDLRGFISGFVATDNPELKNGLLYGGEQLFLLPHEPPVYLFVQARDHEIIKAIQKRDVSVQDIRSALKGDSVGFASYVLIDKHWLGIGCRVLSPRITAFTSFVQNVFHEMRIPYLFLPIPLTEQLPRSDVHKLYQVNSVSVGMEIANTKAQDILNVLTGGATDRIADVAGLEVTIRRRRKGQGSIRDVAQAIVNSVPEDGLESLDARAKVAMSDHVTDVYIIGQGGLRDFVPADSEAKIAGEMHRRAVGNSTLQEKLGELRANEKFQTVDSPRDLHLDWESASADSVRPAAKRAE